MRRRPPVWLLDVDGVLNVRRPLWGADLRRGVARSDGVDWPIRWAPSLITRIRRLSDTRLVEVRWCTTWCPDADALERLFGLPAFGRALTAADLQEPADDTDPAKLAAARGVLAEQRRLIWTDDTAVPAPGPLADELTAAGRALLIRPHPRRGLRPRDLARIEAFADRVRTGQRLQGAAPRRDRLQGAAPRRDRLQGAAPRRDRLQDAAPRRDRPRATSATGPVTT